MRRDWMVAGDLAPQFSNLYPEILDPLVSEEAFRGLVRGVNGALEVAFRPGRARSLGDFLAGLVTGWVWDDLGMAGVKGELAALEKWVEKWNAEIGAPEGVQVVSLRRTAYLCLDIQIPDPRISMDGATETERGPSRSETLETGRSGSRGSGSFGGGEGAVEMDYPTVPKIPERYLEENLGRAGAVARAGGGR